MSPALMDVLAAAECLSAPEKRELVELLLEKLDEPTEEHGNPELTEAWKEEIEKRSEEYDAGQAETVAWEDVKARWRAAGPTDG
ncbi:MAG TPA: addiction module protein [Gemmataceae bacterium]|nr:addiction module protein [Gemmataceae bacterium]